MVDSNGDLRIHRGFDAFGKIVDETHYNGSGTEVTAGQAGFVDQAFAFTGWNLDADTRLQNNVHRWYDSTVGRWLSEDPIGFVAGDANLYRYVQNEPTGRIDPIGLVAVPAAGAWAVLQGTAGASAAAVVGGGVAVAGAGVVGYKFGEALAPYTSVPLAAWVVGSNADTVVWTSIPRVDPTGKLHDDLPADVPIDWGGNDVRDALEEVIDSIRERIRQNLEKGRDQGHDDRLDKEREWQRKLQEWLSR